MRPMTDRSDTNLPFMKMHGLGNDFVVLDARDREIDLSDALVRNIADRHRGVGFDQLAVIRNGSKDAHLEFYNADGSMSSACGNATRCIARYLMTETGQSDLSLTTDHGTLAAKDMGEGLTSVNMGLPGLAWQDIPLSEAVDTLSLPIDGAPVATGMGNPHCTFFVEDAEAVKIEERGALIEHHPLFPKRTKLVCINGSHEEIELNRAADINLLCDPGVFLDKLVELKKNNKWKLNNDWFDKNKREKKNWIDKTLDELNEETEETKKNGGKIHPLQLALDVQEVLTENDWLVIDGGNTHFWSEIAINIAGSKGKKLGGILHPGTFSMLGVGVPFAVSAKNLNPKSNVVLISGDGAFLSGGLSIEAAFQEKKPIVVVIDNNGGLDCISQQQERLFESGKHFATDFRDIPFHSIFEGFGGHGELVTKREDLGPALKRALESGKTACVNVKAKGVISPIVAAVSDKRDKASIE